MSLGNEPVSFLILGFVEWIHSRWEKIGRRRGYGECGEHIWESEQLGLRPRSAASSLKDTSKSLAGLGPHLSLVQLYRAPVVWWALAVCWEVQ